MKKITKAVIPAAGYGTRFLPATKSIPKEMLPIIDKPTLQFIVEEAVNAGITDILIIISRDKESIINHFDTNLELEEHLKSKNKLDDIDLIRSTENLANIYYIRQDSPKGLGHAISLAKNFVGDDYFAVLLGDDMVVGEPPAISQLINAHYKYSSTILGIQEVLPEFVNKYGIIEGEKIENDIFDVKSMIEKPDIGCAPTNYAILGRYVISPNIFQLLEKQNPGKDNEIQLTDALMNLSTREKVFGKIFTGKRYDVGSKIGFIKATIDRALGIDEFKDETIEYITEIYKSHQK